MRVQVTYLYNCLQNTDSICELLDVDCFDTVTNSVARSFSPLSVYSWLWLGPVAALGMGLGLNPHKMSPLAPTVKHTGQQ